MRAPSEVTDKSWIWAAGDDYFADDREPEPNSGKWLIFIQPDTIDHVWATIRDAVVGGNLTFLAKVATARPNPNAMGTARVICVYTHDGGAHATLVRERLRALGFDRKLPWKSDEQTYAGEYANRGFTKISKRYE